MPATDAPIPFRRRQDLQVVPQMYGTERYWVVKDPVSLQYTRLSDKEYALFDLLDGQHDFDDLVSYYESKFAPGRLRKDEVARFVMTLRKSQLLIAERPGHGEALYEQGRKRRRSERLRRWTNPLAVRFRGIDPTRLFDFLYPLVRPLLSRPVFVLSCAFILGALAYAAGHWRTIVAETPGFRETLTPANILLLMTVIGGVKVLHEFGHGLVCRRFGGGCHELGMMLLIFTPCLYCNVSDAWTFPSKWRRAAVGAAGIYVELLLASLALVIWAQTAPGLLHQMSFAVMTVCSVSTVVFNGNPLMRYDGYYILSDLVEVPNLAQRSNNAARGLVLRFFSKEPADAEALLPARRVGWYVLYAAASFLYRWLVTFTIIVLLIAAARPYKLEYLVRLLGVSAVVTLVIVPLYKLARLLNVPGKTAKFRPSRVVAAAVVGGVLIGLFALPPLPHHVLSPTQLQPYRPQQLFVEIGGTVTDAPLPYGRTVRTGDMVVRLKNSALDLELEELRLERSRYENQLASLRREQFEQAAAAAAVPQTEQLLAAVDAKLEEKLRDRNRLSLVADRDGTLFPPPALDPTTAPDDLPNWTGRPLDPENVGGKLEPGTLVAEVGDPHAWEAWIVVDQQDIEYVHVGDRVEVLLDALPRTRFEGEVEEISVGEVTDAPRHLAGQAGGELQTKTEGAGALRPASPSYSVRVRIRDEAGRFRSGWRGTARIELPSAPLAARVYRWAALTFHFHL